MSTDKHALLKEMLRASQPKIAKFARESYAELGRGIVQVTFPKPPPGRAIVIVKNVTYMPLDEMQRVTKGEHSEDWTIAVRMTETYDPERQAVVMATIENELPITVKLKLDPPVMMDDAEGVH